MHCEVGKALPVYFETGSEPVLEIIDYGDHYAIHTVSRGGSFGPAVRAGKDRWSKAEIIQSELDSIAVDVTIDRVFTRASEVLGSYENAVGWLTATLPALGGKRPIDLLNSDAGIKTVLNVLGQIERGIPL